MVTYENLFLFGTFIVSLVSLCYKIFKAKKQPPLLTIMTAVPILFFQCLPTEITAVSVSGIQRKQILRTTVPADYTSAVCRNRVTQ